MIDSEAVEEPAEGGELSTEVRAVPEQSDRAELDSWRGEVKAIAVVAAGGIAAGAATVAAVSIAKRSGASRSKTIRRRVTGNRDVVASRSFLVDVHVLGR